ncbi:hypothetical protein C5167_032963 [Papaver somniferum]|uniref:Uncharacterized protein n=1 Tax=Papaver somniferum TaxID=3469 RepID=A0A4Y7KAA0_PAPSO|nr:hypothetical protein C5167_032963 [Papaver somniferum]
MDYGLTLNQYNDFVYCGSDFFISLILFSIGARFPNLVVAALTVLGSSSGRLSDSRPSRFNFHSLYHVHGANYFPSELFGKVSFDFLGRISFYSGWWKVQMAIRLDFARLRALMRKLLSHHQVAHQFVKVDLTLHQSKAYTNLLVPPEQEKGQVVLYAAGEFVRHCLQNKMNINEETVHTSSKFHEKARQKIFYKVYGSVLYISFTTFINLKAENA